MKPDFPALLYCILLIGFCPSCSRQSPDPSESGDCSAAILNPSAAITSMNGHPVSSGVDLPVQRLNGESIEIAVDYSIVRIVNSCGDSYDGQLTLSLSNLPQGVSAIFDPVVVPVSTSYGAQASHLHLQIAASVPDGAIPLDLRAQEYSISSPNYRIVLTTSYN